MPQPVEVKGGVFLWIWGEIQGFDKGDEYISRFQSHQNSSIEFCSELYKERGEDFISDLNGEFSGVIYDSNDAEVILFNDRLGSRPVYYSKIDNSLIFSTQTQAILNYPETNSAIDVEMLAEFLSATYGSLGTRTIFRNIKELHPASKLKYKIKEGDSNNKIYWIPKYKPKNKPFSYFTKKFKEAIKKAVAERTAENDTNYGLLISGGSDSRLLVSLLEEVTCYHMNEHMNEEAKISQRVSKESGNEFVFLKRGIDYQENVLERGGKITNFNSWFNQGHLLGFSEEISNEVDVLLSGTWA
ncbi:MAG: asparagine synthase-related protein, partial [Candidatus Aenigmatarchaeota archaeon]